MLFIFSTPVLITHLSQLKTVVFIHINFKLGCFVMCTMEQRTLRNVNNYWNTNTYSYLETSGGQSSHLYLKVVHFFNTSVN
jgi:hypothetical protein